MLQVFVTESRITYTSFNEYNIDSIESVDNNKNEYCQENYFSTNVDVPVKLRINEMNDIIKPTTIIKEFYKTQKKFPLREAIKHKVNGNWEHYTWKEYYDTCLLISQGFIKLGLKRGEGVTIIGFNSPEWFISNMGAIMAGGISVGTYTTNSPEICEHIIKDSNSTIVVVENKQQLEKIMSISNLWNIKAIIQYKGTLERDHENIQCLNWDEFLEYSKIGLIENDITKHFNIEIDALRPNKCCSLIYTSGTTGLPKGVMLSHDNILWTVKNICNLFQLGNNCIEKVVSYLPLSHVAAQTIDLYMPLVVGGVTYFAEPSALKGTLGNTLKEVRPTVLMGVPRVWEKIMEKMNSLAQDASTFKKLMLKMAKYVGLKNHYKLENGDFNLPFGYSVFDSIVYQKVRVGLGLDKCKLCISGAAPISLEALEYFASLGIDIQEVYGMSETTGCISIAYPTCFKTGSCGLPSPNTEFKLDNSTNEICTRGRHVMMGYLNRDDKTCEAIDEDGWLHSGDIGEVDEKGFLKIVGRMKDIIITAGGENIPPILIENNIKAALPIISNCMLIGDKKKFLSCLITLKHKLNEDGNPTNEYDNTTIELLKEIGSNVQDPNMANQDETLRKYIQNGIMKANNKSISKVQRVQKFTILNTDFSINGSELGPTLKLKRNFVVEKYNDIIEAMYQ